MAILAINDTGSLRFFATKDDGTERELEMVGWLIDTESLRSIPIVFPDLGEGEKLFYRSNMKARSGEVVQWTAR